MSSSTKIKHGITGYVRHKCRCEICKNAKSESNKESLIKLRNKLKNGDLQIKTHGNAHAVALGCKCDLCKSVMRENNNKRYESHKEFFRNTGLFKTPKVQHGTYTAYKIYGCRCEKCRGFIASKHREKVSRHDKKH